ncbi:conserved hypothetical protein [Candidatus Desulfarcum epimagneticum]|uniref:Pyruvate/ketoisovalerate oxidoreductase catalytic domain-containing protein n=1 Tax=uncultured Desulfobacteraceae bacterium TaxID=218296 RepID=A0A484HDH5_9BACT|nr:conserved hypothetical protein [uncultured Desulfobacteraceae bacterium]
MNTQIALAGVGGQGILFATKLLAETAIRSGYDLTGSETHGMSQRGGSVVSYLKIGDFLSPLLSPGSADYLLAFEPNEACRNLALVRTGLENRSGGRIYANAGPDFPSPPFAEFFKKNKIKTHVINADQIALDMGAPLSTNLIMLGFACADPDFPFSPGELTETARQTGPERFREANVKALETGRQAFV